MKTLRARRQMSQKCIVAAAVTERLSAPSESNAGGSAPGAAASTGCV